MPSLQLDVPDTYDLETKRTLAARLGAEYAAIMQAPLELITVVVRDRGEGSVWRCGDDGPTPSALLMCDVRAGRPAEVRAELGRVMGQTCADVLGVDPSWVKVEFTQHSGDEMYHPRLGGFNTDWAPADTTRPPDVPRTTSS